MSGTLKPKCNTSGSGVRYVLTCFVICHNIISLYLHAVLLWALMSLVLKCAKMKVNVHWCIKKLNCLKCIVFLFFFVLVSLIPLSNCRCLSTLRLPSPGKPCLRTHSNRWSFQYAVFFSVLFNSIFVSMLEVYNYFNSLSAFKDHELSPSRSEEETVDHLPWRGRLGLRRCGQVISTEFCTTASSCMTRPPLLHRTCRLTSMTTST